MQEQGEAQMWHDDAAVQLLVGMVRKMMESPKKFRR